MTRPIQASLDLQALKQNLSIVRQAAPHARVWSVVKANAYGHGIERIWSALAQLDDWRSRLRCPLHFGAPFGFLEDGDFFCLVGIRSLYWQGQRLALCTGGGVVASSTLTHEWRELKLKRDTVRRSFHLP